MQRVCCNRRETCSTAFFADIIEGYGDNRMNRFGIVTRVCALILCAAFLLAAFSGCAAQSGEAQPTIISGMSITPQNEDDAGVAYDSGFYIRSQSRLSKRELEKGLTVEPAISYDISATDDGFFLKPDEPLASNTVYAFTFTEAGGLSRTWAVQSRRPFEVVSSSPSPDAADVWTYAGIELNFSHPGVELADYIEVSPTLDYKVENRGRTVVVYPNSGYRPNTRYTVTVKKGLKSPLGDILAEDYRLSFTTTEPGYGEYNRRSMPVYLYSEYSETFLQDDTPVIRLGVNKNEDGSLPIRTDVSVSVSRFNGSEAYMQALTGRDEFIKSGGDGDEYRCSEDTLDHYVSFTTQFLDYDWSYGYVVLPEALPKGFYAVTVTTKDFGGNEYTVQKLLQISNVSVYTQSVNGQTLAWLNDAQSGSVIKGANVGLLEAGSAAPALTAVTDSSGIAQFATGEKEVGYLFAKVDAENEYVERIPLSADQEPNINELYYSFLFKDRELYLPTDTVKLWGRLAPRADGAVLPKALTLHLTTGSWLGDEYVQETIVEAPVTLLPNGSFTAEISYESLSTDYYQLILMDEEETEYCSNSINVYEYEKPVYQFSALSGKEFYTADDTVDYLVGAQFYNGTPVPGMTFETTLNEKPHSLVTDSLGKATLRVNEDGHFFDDQTSWMPYTLTAYLSSTGLEDQQYYLSPSAVIFPRDIMLTTKREQDGFEKKLTLYTNRVDTSKISRRDEIFEDYPSSFKGASVNIPVDVAVYRVDYLKEQYASYYNPVDKRTVPVYNYTRKETLTKRYTVSTVNGTAVLSDLPNPTNNEQFYRIELTYKDTKGRTVVDTEYYGYYEELYQTSELKSYRFANDKKTQYKGLMPYWYNPYGGYEASYALGETVRISLLENAAPVTGGTMLYTLVQDGIEKSGVSDTASVSFTQSEQYLPNLTVVGAYFDGRHIYPVDSCRVTFDTAERAVKLSAVPDKKQYKPGDTVQLAITAADRSGKPVAADIAISVVDEALFSVSDQSIDPLSTLYQSVFSYNITSFASYNQYNFNRGGEGGKGGGGGGETGGGNIDKRDNFLDTAAFAVAKTDQTGKASVSFTLPDNLTSWRITSAAVTDNLYAGANVTNITTTLPLFVSPVYNTTYIEGDSVAFNLRAYGENTASGEDINYSVTVTGKKNQKETKTLTLPSGTTTASFDFGMLAAGDYKVLFTAQSGKHSDGAEFSFTVKQSALEMPITRAVTPSEVSSIGALKYPVWLGFYDSQYGEYIKTLESLAAQYGERADQRTAATVATALLKEYADDDALTIYELPETDFADYQQSQGGVRVYSYDYPSVQLTARMAAAAPHLYNTETMVSYLNKYIERTWYDQSQVCAALMGLAALKQPVLTDAKAMLKRADSLSDIDILNLCLALAYLGDTDGAVMAYNTHIAPYLITGEYWSYFDSALTTSETIYTEDGTVMEQGFGKGDSAASPTTRMGANLQHTALILLLSQQTGCADTEALLRYVRENSSFDVSTLLEQTAFITRFVPTHTNTAVVRFNRGLLPTTLELKKGGIQYVPFNKNQLVKANITTDGDVGITAMYTGLPDTLSTSPSSEIAVTKSITRLDGGAVRLGETAKITLTVTLGDNAPTGRYDLSDWIPSALRFQNISYDSAYSWGGVWLDSREGQRLTMRFYHDGSQTQDISGAPTIANTYTITYYARCVTKGDSAVDRTYAIHTASSAVNYTPKGTLTTKDGAKPLTLSSK